MDPADFRRDPWLRTSGYHLATWSLVALVLELRRVGGGSASGAAVILAAAVLTSLTHERRVGKMAGPALVPTWHRAGWLWSGLFALFVVAAFALAAAGGSRWLVPLALAALGVGYVVWGRFVGLDWFSAIGVATLAAAAVDAAVTRVGQEPVVLRVLVLGALLPAAGLWTSRKYLWFR